MFDLIYISFFESGEAGFSTERIDVCFLVVVVKPGLVSCVSDAVFPSLK
jgi:hypothetical protein